MRKGITILVALCTFAMVICAYAHYSRLESTSVAASFVADQKVVKTAAKTDENIEEVEMINLATGVPSVHKAVFNRKTNEFKWTPAPGESGNYQVKFTAKEGKRAQSEIVKVTVKKPQ